MREIRFRAWNGKAMGYFELEDICANGDVIYALGEGGYSTDMPVMQYTGMKDKCGAEIYEGDIIQYKCGFVRLDGSKIPGKVSIKNYEVRWESNKARWGRYRKGGFNLLAGLESWFLEKWYTVVGNIYETPDLLEAHNDN